MIFTLMTSCTFLLLPPHHPDSHYPPGPLRYWLMNRTILSGRHNQGSSDLRGEVQRAQRAGIPREGATLFSPLITGRPDSWTKLDRQVLGVALYQFPPQPCVSSRAPYSVFISRTFIHLCHRPSTFHPPPTFSCLSHPTPAGLAKNNGLLPREPRNWDWSLGRLLVWNWVEWWCGGE